MEDGLSEEIIIHGIKESLKKKIKDFPYIRGILNNYVRDKIYTVRAWIIDEWLGGVMVQNLYRFA